MSFVIFSSAPYDVKSTLENKTFKGSTNLKGRQVFHQQEMTTQDYLR